MQKPLISVIVPVYNAEKYLHRCVDSILNQTYKNLEIILIDDGSKDSSGTICDAYAAKDSRIKVIHQKNFGVSAARNAGLDAAFGDYITFVDSDDSIKADMLEKLVSKLQRENADLVICGSLIDNGIRLTKHPKKCKEKIYSTEELMKDYVCADWIFTGPCNKLYKYELFNDIRFPEFRAHEDAFIMHHILGQCKKAVFIEKYLYIQYLRQNSTERSKFSQDKLTLLDCADDLLLYYQKNFPMLYKYVAYRKVNEIAVILADILKSGMYQSQRLLYHRLYQKMQEEYKSARNNGVPNELLNTYAKRALGNPILFRMSIYRIAAIETIKKYIKRLIGRKG